MVLKRKRSSDFADSSPASTNSVTSYLCRSSQSPSPLPYSSSGYGSALPHWPHPQIQPPSYSSISTQILNSRTRKRWRDLRPDIETVHAQTLQKLYDAQQLYPHASPVPSNISPILIPSIQQPVQKTSLHSFWNLPGSFPSINPKPVIGPPYITHGKVQAQDLGRCEDCDSPLDGGNEDHNIMELDCNEVNPGISMKCAHCGRRICNFCAVMKEKRICLECATEGGV